MRGFQCYYYYYDSTNTFRSTQTACWSMVNRFHNSSNYCTKVDCPKMEIYIKDFKQDEITEKERNKLITIINKVTPCSIVTIDGIEYIKFKLLHSYDSSLILLNYIRNLWHIPGTSGTNEQSNAKYNYKEFFNVLMKKRTKDPISLLCHANIAACKDVTYGPGHSNCQIVKGLKIKTKEDLLNFKGKSTYEFLTV